MVPSARRHVSDAHTRVRVLRTIKGARVSSVPGMKIILVFRLVALVNMRLENEMHIYLFIVV